MTKLILTLFIAGFATLQASNLVPWSANRKLTWSDFTGTPPPSATNAALTSSNINFEFVYDEKSFHYSIQCNFDKNRSWVRIKNNEVLAHEQGHFDIAAIYARHLNKLLKSYRFNARTVSTDVNKIYEQAMKLHRQIQIQYDEETDYSRNRPRQEEWLKKIAGDLKSLEAFADYQQQ